MLELKMIALLTFSLILLGGGGTTGCRMKQITNLPGEKSPSGELSVLAEGFHSAITHSFVAVVRDADTYEALTKLEGKLPKRDAEFFKSNIVVAAFLGERNTGGYSVEISRDPNGRVQVGEKAPGKNVIVPQMITSPFKVVSLSVSGLPPVSLSIDHAFQEPAQLYRVTTGTFKVFGGVGGMTEEFRLEGELQLMREHDLVTISFALNSAGATRERSLRDNATGLIKDDRVVIPKLSHGSLLNTPGSELQASGAFQEKNKLLLELVSGDVMVPDGYTGKGSVEAVMVGASAN